MKKENRYRLAYGTLLLLLLLFLALNICAGSVNISVSEVGRVLTGRGTDTVFSRRGAGPVRIPFADFFSQSHCRPFYSGHFLRREAGGGPCDGSGP